MKKSSWMLILVGITLIGLVVITLPFQSPVLAAPNPQMTNFPTPTPGSDGRIIYVVQEGDTLWRIAAVSGLDLADLRDLNQLGLEDIVYVGQQLILGLGGPAGEQATAAPGITEESAEPTDTPVPGLGTLCVLLFEDINGDSMRQEEEISLPGGAINISNRDGSISITEDTLEHNPSSVTDDYFCTEGLDEGDYNVSVALPEGYNPTSTPGTSGSTPLLGVIGAILLLGGIGLGVYSIWFRR